MGQESFSSTQASTKAFNKGKFRPVENPNSFEKQEDLVKFNIQSLILFAVSLIFFSLSIASGQIIVLKWILLFVSADLFISALLLKPFKLFKTNNKEIKNIDFSHLYYNSNIDRKNFYKYIIWFTPRILLYILIVYLFPNYLMDNNYIAGTVLTLGSWITLVSILFVIFLVQIFAIAIKNIIDEISNGESTRKAIKNIRLGISNSAKELDKVISSINSYKDPRLSEDNRKRIANLLFKVRNYLVIDNQTDPTFTPDLKVKFVQTEKELTEELLINLKNDKCVVCYSSLDKAGAAFLVCPICGHGGHKDHIETWFQTKTVCPSCSSDVTSKNFLLLQG